MEIDPLILTRGVHFAATVLASGTVAFMTLILGPTSSGDTPDHARLRRRLIQMTWVALALGVVSGAVWLALVASNILGASLVDVCLNGGIFTVAANTRFGDIAALRLVIALALGLLLLWPAARWPQIGLATALAGLIALTGHAGSATGAFAGLHLASDIVHLTAAAAWLGALPALAMLLLSRVAGAMAVRATARFSVLGIVCVAALLASGLINSWALLGGPRDLIDTRYGQLLALKIGLFVAMAAIATVNKYRVTARLPARTATRTLARNALAETALGLAALFLAGALGTLPPSGHVHISSAEIPPTAAFVHIHGEQAMADLTIDPGQAGPATATIRLLREDFSPFPATSVRLALDPSNAGSSTVERAASVMPDGTWSITGLNIPAAGVWTARVMIGTGTETIVLDAPIVITQCSNEC